MTFEARQDLESCKFSDYVQQVLEYISGQRDRFEFTKSNQFEFIALCDLFQLQEAKHSLMNHLTFDVSSVFDFLMVAAEEPSNREALRESYWIIVYIYLKKIGWDIAESI